MWFLLARAAFAQDVDVPAVNAQLFRPTIDAGGLLWTDDAARARSGQATGRLLLSYTADPLVYVYEDGERVEVVSDVLQTNLLGGYTLGRLRLGADVPLYLRSDGSSGGETGLGDVAGDVKLSLLRDGEAPLGLALGGRLALPTATVETSLGSSATAWELQGILDKRLGDVLLALNVGTRGLPREQLEGVTWDDQLFFRTGGAYDITDNVGASAELVGSLTYGELGVAEGQPLEGMLGGWARPTGGNMVVRYGVGTGLTTGVGAPTLRTLLAVGYEPPTGDDTDADGIIDSRDACPTAPEDYDSYRDADGCPDPTAVVFQIVDARDDSLITDVVTVKVDGAEARLAGTPLASSDSYEVTVTAAGYSPSTTRIQVPGGATHDVRIPLDVILPGRLVIRVQDPDGEPISEAIWSLDGAARGAIGSAARTELPPGSYRVAAAADGYLKTSKITNIRADLDATVELVLRPTTIAVTRDRIDLGGKIYFETGEAIIKEESFPLLTDVANVMTEYPEIRRLRIEGHTDIRGSASNNQSLSEKRAAAVVAFLAAQGIEAARLASIGYGESKPVDSRQTGAAYEKNRRVDFFVEEWVEIERDVPAPQ